MTSENENVEIAIHSASVARDKIEPEVLLIKQDDLEEIVRLSFLYQSKPIEDRGSVTESILQVINNALGELHK